MIHLIYQNIKAGGRILKLTLDRLLPYGNNKFRVSKDLDGQAAQIF